MRIWSTAFILLFIIDPIGNVPILLSVLKNIPRRRQFFIIFRELLIGLGIMTLFLYFGQVFLSLFHLETGAITISGGIIFFIFGINMIFPSKKVSFTTDEGEPFIVPIAMPLIAGPGVLATLVVMGDSVAQPKGEIAIALLIAWVIACITLLLSPLLYKLLKEKGIKALERLMGLLLLMISIQMFIDGMRTIIPLSKILN